MDIEEVGVCQNNFVLECIFGCALSYGLLILPFVASPRYKYLMRISICLYFVQISCFVRSIAVAMKYKHHVFNKKNSRKRS